MFASDEELEDDNSIFDQLKSIKPFPVDQLYLLHPDVGCPPTQPGFDDDDNQQDGTPNSNQRRDKEIYQNLIEYEQHRHKLAKIRNEVKSLYGKTCEHIDKAWHMREESRRQIAMCQQGKIAETTFKFKQAVIVPKQLELFSLGHSQLAEVICKDYIYYSFESQIKRNKIATQLSISYQTTDIEARRKKLRSAISTLIDFIKHLGDSKSDFVLQCRKWLRATARRYLESGSTEDYRFIIAQIARGPVGTADWSADLIECKPFEQVDGHFESVPEYITHCSTLLSQLFYSLKLQLKEAKTLSDNMMGVDDKDNIASDYQQPDNHNWSLIDPRFSCSEELNLSSACASSFLSEADVIKFCLKIPIAQIFRAYVKKCLVSNDEFRQESDKNYEYVMLKLLTIGTIIIKTYQIGLETFNSIQYGNLIEYLSSQIRRTVIILSDQWIEFRSRLRGVDDALLMRLQVEYDNFILRSILIILELRQSGIWRHLSRVEPSSTRTDSGDNLQSWSTESLKPTLNKLLQVAGLSSPPSAISAVELEASHRDKKPVASSSTTNSTSLTYEFSVEWFREVSDPMLWHILWQFYHNAFVSLCDYHSDNYWLEKFQEKSVVYLFVNKIRDSPPGECSYLLNSITSMLLSRNKSDSKLVNFIAAEIFNLCFKYETLREKVTKKGIRSLIRCAERFPDLIGIYIDLIADNDNLGGAVGGSVGENEDIIELIRGCSLSGWLCDDEEMALLSQWLVEYPLTSPRNKIARLVISKICLNSPETRESTTIPNSSSLAKDIPSRRKLSLNKSDRKNLKGAFGCFVDLKMRRKLALLLHEASRRHYPENNEFGPQSLGASVEVAFGGLYCERGAMSQNNLLDLAVDSSYQQFYVWAWRLLFTLRLHILNQAETDWNDVQSRSGTSRSIKNTVLLNDSFHPVPSLQDSECLSLAVGVKGQNPLASFIYLIMTDATWQADTLETCLDHLNVLANSGHITPSLMAMEYLTTCHLNDLLELMVNDKQSLDYFTTVITSNFDPTRLASLIACQLSNLKQYRQLQLSQFYINTFLEVATTITKQISASWFTSNEISFEKIACLLDYIVRFNFATQRLEIIRKFYECSYSVQGNQSNTSSNQATTSWLLGSLFATNSLSANSTRREFLTNLHVLTQKFKKYSWLRWVTTECDTLRLERIWEEIVVYLSGNEDANLDSAIKKICPQVNSAILKATLPIYSWMKQIFDLMESDPNHPLCPLIWYNFFLNYFANSLNGVSVGTKLVPAETIGKLMSRLDSLFNYHLYKHRNWASTSAMQQNSLAQLYRAYKLWLQDASLSEAYVDIDRLKDDYLVPLLKAVMESSTEGACLQYIDVQGIETQNRNLMQVWNTATHLNGNRLIKDMVFVDSQVDDSMEILTSVEDEASDAVASLNLAALNGGSQSGSQQQHHLHPNLLAAGSSRSNRLGGDEVELMKPVREDLMVEKYQTVDELMELIKHNFHLVFEESTMFGLNLIELNKIKMEIMELVRDLYTNTKREFVRFVACIDGNECAGPARIRIEAEEASMDERKSQCIQDRRRQCQELIGELLLMPKNRTVQSTVLIEDYVRRLIEDPSRSGSVTESLLKWISEPNTYKQLNGSYYAANHLLKTVLEILSNSQQVDIYNTALIDVCLAHPDSVQIFSPHLSPSVCTNECFVSLYKTISSRLKQIGPMAMFVLLSKFDMNAWLANNAKQMKMMHHELINATCSALKDLGKCPDPSYELTFDLFKRHLQIELAPPERRKPEEIALVLANFLQIMGEQSLAPSLWTDFMTLFGLERNIPNGRDSKSRINSNRTLYPIGSPLPQENRRAIATTPLPSKASFDCSDSIVSATLASVYQTASTTTTEHHNETTILSTVEDVGRLAECQLVFDYHSVSLLIKKLCNHLNNKHQTISVTLMEQYQDYLDQFSVVILGVTFIWIKSISENYPDNHELIWEEFANLWRNWVFLDRNCQNVGKASYSLFANYYVAAVRYMTHKIPDNTQAILHSVLRDLAQYVAQTREVVYLELTILQRCLKNLNWSSLVLTTEDLNHLASLSEQENYNISDLISHVILQVDMKVALTRIQETESPSGVAHVAERLATIIIIQSTHLKGYRLHGRIFSLIETAHIKPLAQLILPRMEFVNLEHSLNNKLLVNLLRYMCIKIDTPTTSSDSPTNHHHQMQQINSIDLYDRSLIYAQFVSNYLIDLIKRHPTVAKHHRAYLEAVLDNSLQDLKLLTSAELNLTQKTLIYESLLECCSCDSIESESRLLLAKALLESSILKGRPIVVLEILHAIGQILRDAKVLVFMIETLIDLYMNMGGHYEKVWKSFCLKILPSDIYLSACIEERAAFALLVYFESLTRGGGCGGCADQQTDHSLYNDSLSANEPSFNNSRIWSSFFHWLAQLIAATDVANNASKAESPVSDAKLATVCLRMLGMLEQNLQLFLQPGESTTLAHTGQTRVEKAAIAEVASIGSSSSDSNSTLASSQQQSKQAVLASSNVSLRVEPPSLLASHKCLLDLVKQLISLYDSVNSGGLWSYLKSSARSDQTSKISITCIAIACFLAERTLACLNTLATTDSELPSHLICLKTELTKSKKACLSKLETARRSKSYIECTQFIETVIESVQRNDKVQYSESVQLLANFVKSNYSMASATVQHCI